MTDYAAKQSVLNRTSSLRGLLLGMKMSSLVSTREMIEDKLQGEELLLEGISLPPYLKLEPFLFGLPLWVDSK
uniref:Uncharacterized protein n=1 Tax=Cucumis melo TaxID=3656 RepID=A0A9I9E1R1_CUCME